MTNWWQNQTEVSATLEWSLTFLGKYQFIQIAADKCTLQQRWNWADPAAPAARRCRIVTSGPEHKKIKNKRLFFSDDSPVRSPRGDLRKETIFCNRLINQNIFILTLNYQLKQFLLGRIRNRVSGRTGSKSGSDCSCVSNPDPVLNS